MLNRLVKTSTNSLNKKYDGFFPYPYTCKIFYPKGYLTEAEKEAIRNINSSNWEQVPRFIVRNR